MASNYSDVIDQLRLAGLLIGNDGLRIGTSRPVRCLVEGQGKEKRGWYLLREWSPSAERTLIVGSYGVWHGNDNGAQKIALPKDDRNRMTPEQSAALRKQWAEQAKAAELERERDAAVAAEHARKMWAKLRIEGESPYLRAKGVPAVDVKYTPNNCAVIRLVDTGGNIHGLQFLRSHKQAAEGKRPAKEFWPSGLAKKGHFSLLGNIDWIVLVAEGYATAASLHAATGYPVVVAFDAGNLLPVVEALRKRFKRAKILVCADDDCFTNGNPGVTAASAAALAVNGEWVKPTFADETARHEKHAANGRKITDFNDLHLLEGADIVREQIAQRLADLRWYPPVLGASILDAGGRGSALRPIDNLTELLERFALVHGMGGSVFDRREHALMTLADVRNICQRGELFKAWMEHADRCIVRQQEIGFDPACTDVNVTCNLWAGWPTEAKPGNCERLLNLLQYLCSAERNQRELFTWVLRWFAYPIQHPGAKMRTCIVFHGGQGAGKNLFCEAIMAIYGQYGRILDQDALIDKHNDWASRKLYLIADEVVAQAHRFEQKNKLKTLITGTWIRINPKHIAAYDEANHVNIVFLSNEIMPVVLEEDDRRHCIIWTPPKLDKAYYKAITDEIDAGGIAALHDYLLHLDLGDFNPGTEPPSTEAKNELIDLATDSPVDFVDELFGGRIDGLTPMPGITTDWYGIYKNWCQLTGANVAPLKRFVGSIHRRRGFDSTVERFRLGGSIKQQRLLLWGLSPPEGVSKQEWLGDRLIDFDEKRAQANSASFLRRQTGKREVDHADT